MISLVCALLLATPLVVDAEKHSVAIEVAATGCNEVTQLEFLLVDPQSEKDYEALFVTTASQKEIATAFQQAGIPVGKGTDFATARLWPVGQTLEVTPALTNWVQDLSGAALPAVIYTGGTTNTIDGYVFAFYNCPQSLLQFNDSLSQSPTYGRFRPQKQLEKGQKQTLTFTWKGVSTWAPYTLTVKPGNLQEALLVLKAQAEQHELDVQTDFDGTLTLADAQATAQVLELLDSPRVKINGSSEGQFYYRAFLPKEQWRDRKERLVQPPELYLQADDTWKLVEIQEDWSDEDSLDPKLNVVEHAESNLDALLPQIARLAEKSQTVFLFAPGTTALEAVYKLKASLKTPVYNWYIFTHD